MVEPRVGGRESQYLSRLLGGAITFSNVSLSKTTLQIGWDKFLSFNALNYFSFFFLTCSRNKKWHPLCILKWYNLPSHLRNL